MLMKEKRREISYDVIRCVAMLFVIAVHANPKPYQSGSLWQELFLAVFFSCNGLFFMLSGRFALAKKLDGVRGILTFYRRKLFSVFIPLVFFGAIYCLVDLYQDGVPFTFGMFLETAAKGLTGDLRDTYKENKRCRLFFLLMNSHFITSRTVFLYFHFVWMFFLISRTDVIFFTTFCTFECYKFSRHLK